MNIPDSNNKPHTPTPSKANSTYTSSVDTMSINKEVIEHLFVNVLKLNESNIKVLRKDVYWRYSKFAQLQKSTLEKLHFDKKIAPACWQEIRCFRMYIDECGPSKLTITAMTAATNFLK